MVKRWTKFHKFVQNTYMNKTHSSGKDVEGENIPLLVRPLYEYLHKNQPSGPAYRQAKERVDKQVMPRQRPLGPNPNASPRSEISSQNTRMGVTTLTPNSNEKNNRTVPAGTTIEIQSLTKSDFGKSTDANKSPSLKKRKRNKYHDAIFGDAEGIGDLQESISKTTNVVAGLLSAQRLQIQNDQTSKLMASYQLAKQNLDNATDAEDIEFYTIAKRNALKAMRLFDQSSNAEEV